MIFWHCPSCDEKVLQYAGPNPSGPTSSASVRRAAWRTLEGTPFTARYVMPECDCGKMLEGRLDAVRVED